MPADLHGFRPAKQVLLKEDGQDRLILLLKAQGLTNRRIAEQLGISELKVSYTTRQEWFMKQLVELLHEKGEQEIERCLKVFAADALNVAHDLMMNSQDERIRAQAAFEFIKAHRGTKVVVEDHRNLSLEELNAQIQELEKDISDVTQPRITFNPKET